MAGFEDVIERALEKNAPTSPEMRERIYNSARNALAGMLSRSDNLTPEAIYVQQQRLEQAITDIEARHELPETAAMEPVLAEPVISAEPDAPTGAEQAPAVTAEYDGQSESHAPVYMEAAPEPGYEEQVPGIAVVPKRKRRIFSKILMAAIVVAAFGIAGWWAYGQNLFSTADQRDTSVPNPPKVIESEDFQPKPASSTSKPASETATEWINIYEPSDPEGLITGGIITAELSSDGEGPYVRLKAPLGGGGISAKFKVDPGVMASIRGKNATFELKVKSKTGDSHQFAVTCQLKQLGNCGRKRFNAGSQAEPFVFKAALKDQALAGAEDFGLLSINTDISGKGKSLDVYMIRVSVE